MVAPLRRVLVCEPAAVGWSAPEGSRRWRALGYAHEPDAAAAQAQHNALLRELEAAGAEVLRLRPGEGLSLDAVYVHDASLMTDQGAICLRMGKPSRAAEPAHHEAFYRKLGVPVLGEVQPPGTAEGGDLVWLDARTLLAGRGFRTNAAGIEQLRSLLAPLGVEVIAAPLPYGAGPGACLHLMSLLSLLDDHTALVDLAWLSVETVELLSARHYELVEFDSGERAALACNVLALGDAKLLAFQESPKTCSRLREHGLEVRTVPGSEVGINGGGGLTCLTRPLLRG